MEIKKVICFFGVLFAMINFGCSGTELQHGLSEEQANDVLVVLQQSGLDAKKVREEGEQPTWAISVPNHAAPRAWKLMKEHDLPRPPMKGISETFDKQSLIPTITEEKALFLQALCNELQRTIESIDGVVRARVHIVLPEEEIIPQENSPGPRAAVLIKYKMNASGEVPYRDESIRAIIANSVQKLDPQDVAVIGTEVGIRNSVSQGNVSYVMIGPLKVAQESLLTFKIIGVSLAIVIGMLAIGLIFSAKRSNSLRRELERIGRARPDKLAKIAG